ncbi:lipocalin-like domain-containing protein [Parabacteroides sp. OttesenSCG-928-J18]|nr:lipocalin-like domain-containing protein [Parabacteroides sp. OttesenSCG-928-J18]
MNTFFKRSVFIVKPLMVLLAASLLFSCTKDIETELDGKWILREVVAVDGSIQQVDTVWYNFQNTLFMYQLYDAATDNYPYFFGFKTKMDEKHIRLEMKSYAYTVSDFLLQSDWENGTREFTIDKKTDNRLILNSEGKEYRFDKY